MKRQEPRYRIEIHWSAEDRCYVVKVPELEGCMTHGKTAREALARAQEAIAGYLESLRARGLPTPPPLSQRQFSAKIPLRINPKLRRDLAVRARIRGVSLNRYIESTLRNTDRA